MLIDPVYYIIRILIVAINNYHAHGAVNINDD